MRKIISYSPADQAPPRIGILPKAIAVLGRPRGLCLRALLVARTPSDWPFCAVDAAGLRRSKFNLRAEHRV
jgi:hypothetical protein